MSADKVAGSMSSVLITDGHWRKTLAVIRALGRNHIDVSAGETSLLATALFSRYCRQRHKYPSPLLHPDQFLDWLFMELKQNHYDVLFPMEDETNRLVIEHHAEISKHTNLLLPPKESFEIARNKKSFYKLCQEKSWPIPRSYDSKDLPESLTGPIIVKPSIGIGSAGVVSLSDRPSLMRYLNEYTGDKSQLVIQEKVPGVGYGLTALFDRHSRVKASFVHRRIREYPVSGGPSTLRISVQHEQVRQLGLEILTALRWTGVAMVEFKVDEAGGNIYLLEINPRYPGSLALAIAAGVNFPLLHFKLACGEDIPEQHDYKTNVMCRWLLPGDILHFIHNRQRFRLDPSFFRFWGPDLHYDIISADDPLPILGRLLAPMALITDKNLRLKARKQRAVTEYRSDRR